MMRKQERGVQEKKGTGKHFFFRGQIIFIAYINVRNRSATGEQQSHKRVTKYIKVIVLSILPTFCSTLNSKLRPNLTTFDSRINYS